MSVRFSLNVMFMLDCYTYCSRLLYSDLT